MNKKKYPKNGDELNFIIKGSNPLTEEYSAFSSELGVPPQVWPDHCMIGEENHSEEESGDVRINNKYLKLLESMENYKTIFRVPHNLKSYKIGVAIIENRKKQTIYITECASSIEEAIFSVKKKCPTILEIESINKEMAIIDSQLDFITLKKYVMTVEYYLNIKEIIHSKTVSIEAYDKEGARKELKTKYPNIIKINYNNEDK